MTVPACRFCGAALEHVFVDLGMSPPSNALLTSERLTKMERYYPLKAFVCSRCFLVQLEEFESPQEIFSDYAYFSSYSTTWLEHCKRYAGETIDELRLGSGHRVVEIASNDGYLLQYFVERGVPVLGVEPAANVAATAIAKGIPTEVAFFGAQTAGRLSAVHGSADLIVANNVLAHVPDINDFVEGVRILLAPGGRATFEFPHLLRLMELNQFDTIYHEHFSYISALTAAQIFSKHSLKIVRIQHLPTHGGSLRIWVAHEAAGVDAEATVDAALEAERAYGLDRIETYERFPARAESVKRRLLEFLIEARDGGQRVAAYGAAAKGTTLFNYCGIGTDFVDFVVDRNPHKQNRFMPGCHVPIYDPERVAERRPDFLLILPWNLRDEIAKQMTHIREWGGRFVVPIPQLEVF
jgi:SAM-dependent methyltransferase